MNSPEPLSPERTWLSVTEAAQLSGLTREEIRYLQRLGVVEVREVREGSRSSLRVPSSQLERLKHARNLYIQGYKPRQVAHALLGSEGEKVAGSTVLEAV